MHHLGPGSEKDPCLPACSRALILLSAPPAPGRAKVKWKLGVDKSILTFRDLVSVPFPCPCPCTQPGRRGCLPLSPQGRPPPLPRGHEQRHRAAAPRRPRGSRDGRAVRLPLRGFSARSSGGPAGEAAPGRERGERGHGAASLPGGHVLSEQAGSAAAAFARPRRAGQLPPAAHPGLVTHLRPGPGPVSAGSPRLRSRRRRRNPRPVGALRAPQRPCRSGGTAPGGAGPRSQNQSAWKIPEIIEPNL